MRNRFDRQLTELNNEMIAVISINSGISKEQFSTGRLHCQRVQWY